MFKKHIHTFRKNECWIRKKRMKTFRRRKALEANSNAKQRWSIQVSNEHAIDNRFSISTQHKLSTQIQDICFFSFYLDFNKSTHCFVSSHFGRMRCYFVLWLGWFFFYYSISLSSSGECVSVSLLSGTKHLSFYSVASIHWSLPWNASNRSFEMPNLHSHLFIYYFQFRFERIEWAWPLCFFPSILNSRSKIQ